MRSNFVSTNKLEEGIEETGVGSPPQPLKARAVVRRSEDSMHCVRFISFNPFPIDWIYTAILHFLSTPGNRSYKFVNKEAIISYEYRRVLLGKEERKLLEWRIPHLFMELGSDNFNNTDVALRVHQNQIFTKIEHI